IAGGIGISPFRGMIRYAADRGLRNRIALLYAARTPDEFAFRRELDALATSWGNLTVRYTVTRPSQSDEPWGGHVGRIDKEMIVEARTGLESPMYYICGTPGMVGATATLLVRRLGVPQDDVRIERFMGY
ncbi:MAG TPA: oxidoreductase, partial [Thermoplasmata archaeon]|nr:oxidoreductase [Thermoplasmata archaeon]